MYTINHSRAIYEILKNLQYVLKINFYLLLANFMEHF